MTGVTGRTVDLSQVGFVRVDVLLIFTPTALVALDAGVELTRRTGTRQMKLSEFLLGSYETALEPGELWEDLSRFVDALGAA